MLRINCNLQIVDIKTEVVVGKLFCSDDMESITYKSYYTLSEDMLRQIEDILGEINDQ